MKNVFGFIFLLAAITVQAQQVTDVTDFIVSGPYKRVRPVATDTLDVNGRRLEFSEGYSKELKFYVTNTEYTKAKLIVKGARQLETLLDGTKTGTTLTLEPSHHEVVLRYVIERPDSDTIRVSIDAPRPLSCTTSPRRTYTFRDVIDGLRVNNALVSPDGKYAIVGYRNVQPGGRTNNYSEIVELATGRIVRGQERYSISWMPRTVAYTYEDKSGDTRLLYKVDPRTGTRSLLASEFPDGQITISPTEDYLILTKTEKTPKDSRDVFRVLEPDDRQPGWRFRHNLYRYDLATRQCQQVTFGYRPVELLDITRDGGRLLVSVTRSRLTKRPTTVTDFLIIDARTLAVDTVMTGAEFLTGARFSPDGRQLLFTGAAEAFDGIGHDEAAGPYSSLYDIQLFLYDLATRRPVALTKDFNPSVDKIAWSAADGQIYFTAKDRDYIHFYVLNPRTRSISQLSTGEDVVNEFSLATAAPVMTYYGVSASNPVRAYALNLKSRKSRCLADCAVTLLRDVELGECLPFAFLSSRGDSISGRYYLPPHFDSTKRYPMIVNYYGGCTPTSRNFETLYPQNYYASQGYVVLVLNPSGACGFGQRFSARHVNTWGQYVADDIIEGVRKFCADNRFVDEKRIGCIGASYGGFMTQYLQTVTDIFACAVSHAGISNIASYWGEGYWGYSYGEVASAGSYPWNAKDMYTDQSPLFHADRIHTPLLLTHGTSDTNVPVMESIQMFTALKLLGREVAFVEVQGEDHWIIDYKKRIQWTNTIMAWFEKYLKGDSTWWNDLYPEKQL